MWRGHKRREFSLYWTSRTSSAASLAASYQLDCTERPLLYTAQKWCSYNSCIIGFWNGSTNTRQKVARVPRPTFVRSRAARWKKSKEPENAPGLAGFSQNSTFQNSQKLARILLLILPQNSSFLNPRKSYKAQKNAQLGILYLTWQFSGKFWKLTT